MQTIGENMNHKMEGKLEQELVGPLLQVIAPWPLIISKLYEDKCERNTNPMMQTTNTPLSNLLTNEYKPQHNDEGVVISYLNHD